jgi:aspartyl-tRNA(Asn)/glutamyl-tRNA(Gln) amidotransferase subunit B
MGGDGVTVAVNGKNWPDFEKRLRDEWEKTGGPLPGSVTVGWVDDEQRTRLLRDKENAQDYRYFPEPDLPPLSFDAAFIAHEKAALPELPRAARERYANLGLESAQAMQLLDDSALRAVFDAVHGKTNDAKRASGLVLTQLQGALKEKGITAAEGPSADAILSLVAAIDAGTISANAGKDVLKTMVDTGKSADVIIKEGGMRQISSDSALQAFVDQAIAANPQAIADIKAGKQAAMGALVGWIMKQTKGQANPAKVNELLRKAIHEA